MVPVREYCTHSATFTAWSPMRSKYLATIKRSMQNSPLSWFSPNELDELRLHPVEELVHHVVLFHHLVGQGQVLADKGVNGAGDHLDGGLGHVPDVYLAQEKSRPCK